MKTVFEEIGETMELDSLHDKIDKLETENRDLKYQLDVVSKFKAIKKIL